MFGWLTRCWGGIGVTNQFEKYLINCSHADWRVPYQSDIKIIMATFKGQSKQTSSDTAFNRFIYLFQNGEQKDSPAFILKNLLILDLAVQEYVFLTKINEYYNGHLLYLNGQSQQINSALNQLITNYYLYIKEKAKIYMNHNRQIFDRNLRKQCIDKLSVTQIKQQVNNCFKLQSLILEVSIKYNDGNRNAELIQYIFTLMLKNYLTCYSIVSIAIYSLLDKVQDLGKYQLQSFYKLAKNFNKDYTKKFFLFVEKNKNIPAFKGIKYNQFTCIDDSILQALYAQSIKMKSKFKSVKYGQSAQELPISTATSLEVEVEKEDDQNLLIFTRRKPLKLKQTSTMFDENPFQIFVNSYSEDFQVDEDIVPLEKFKGKRERSFQLKHKLTLYDDASQPVLKKEIIKKHNQIDQQLWQSWQDVFAY